MASVPTFATGRQVPQMYQSHRRQSMTMSPSRTGLLQPSQLPAPWVPQRWRVWPPVHRVIGLQRPQRYQLHCRQSMTSLPFSTCLSQPSQTPSNSVEIARVVKAWPDRHLVIGWHLEHKYQSHCRQSMTTAPLGTGSVQPSHLPAKARANCSSWPPLHVRRPARSWRSSRSSWLAWSAAPADSSSPCSSQALVPARGATGVSEAHSGTSCSALHSVMAGERLCAPALGGSPAGTAG
mmetsp:Transcript_91499/g.259148  ORF Transcript_91499/g.259148 Transcript_91499/m.259148 type:complete len:236 (-) Transcript_91499:31-738(-)